jgi:hypothetical protein
MATVQDEIRALYLDGRYAQAVDYIRALCKDPDAKRGEEWRAIGAAAANLSDLTSARAAALRWRLEDPEGFEPLLVAAQACSRARDKTFTENFIDVLVRKFPQQPAAWFTAGIIRAEFGDFDQAIYELKRAFALDAGLTPAWDAVARLKPLIAGDPDVDFIAGLPDRAAALPPLGRAAAHYAAATVFDALGDVDRAFDHYVQGAALRRAGLKHDMGRVLGLMRNAMESFDPDLFDRFRGAGAPATGAVFLIAPPRSGAALVEQILASHPRAYGAGEAGVVRMTTWPLGDLRPLFVQDVAKMADRRPWLGLGENFGVFSKELYGDNLYTVYRGVDHIAFAGAIRLMLPYAKLIFIDRDPLDAAWSAFTVNYFGFNPWSFDFEEIAEWRHAYEMTRAAWRERIGGETLDVSYEALVSDPARETKRILKFVGLAPDPACDSFYETRRAAPVESVRRIRSPIDTASLVCAHAYGPRLDPLRSALERRGLASASGAVH